MTHVPRRFPKLSLLRTALLGSLAGIALGCDRGGTETSSGSRSTKPTGAAHLVDAGAEPRAPLARRVTPGAVQSVALAQSLQMGVTFAGEAYPGTAVPRTRSELSVTADGEGYRFVLGEVAVLEDEGFDPAATQEAARELALNDPQGLAGRVVLGPDGAHSRTDFDVPSRATWTMKNLLGQLRQSLALFAVPLPAEPVGTGARWTTSGALDLVDIELAHASTWRLVSRDGDRVTLEVEMDLSAPSQLLELPGMPEDARAELVSLGGKGRGTAIVDLAAPLPQAGELRLSFDMALRVASAGETQAMDAFVRVGLELGP